MAEDPTRAWFAFFVETGSLTQAGRALFDAQLPEGFTLPQFLVLNHLAGETDGLTPQALARTFRVAKTSMTHSLAALEGAGYIATVPNPADGRSKVVTITEAGRDYREEAMAKLRPDLRGLARQYPESELKDLTFRLSLVRQMLDEAREP